MYSNLKDIRATLDKYTFEKIRVGDLIYYVNSNYTYTIMYYINSAMYQRKLMEFSDFVVDISETPNKILKQRWPTEMMADVLYQAKQSYQE